MFYRRKPFHVRLWRHYRIYRGYFRPTQALLQAWRVARI